MNFLRKFWGANAHLKGIAKNASWLMFERIFRLGLGFFVGIEVAKYFGPERYSTYTVSMATIFIVIAIAGLGLRSIVVRSLVNSPSTRSQVMGSSIGMLSISGLVAYGLALVITLFVADGDQLLIWAVALMGAQLLLIPVQVVAYFFEAKVQSKYTVIATFSAYLLGIVAKVCIILFGGTILQLAGVYAAELTLAALILLYNGYRQGIFLPKLSWDTATAKSLLRDSWWLILAGIMISLFTRMDQLMLKKMVEDRETGLYGFAVQLTEAFYFVPVILKDSFFPNLLESHGRGDESEFFAKLGKLARLLVAFAICVALGAYLLADWGLDFLTRGKYNDSAPMLTLIVWSLPFVGLGVVRSAYLVALNKLRYSFYFTTLGATVNLAANLIFIPMYGGWGAALATLLSFSVSAWLSGFLFKETRQITWLMTRSLFLIP